MAAGLGGPPSEFAATVDSPSEDLATPSDVVGCRCRALRRSIDSFSCRQARHSTSSLVRREPFCCSPRWQLRCHPICICLGQLFWSSCHNYANPLLVLVHVTTMVAISGSDPGGAPRYPVLGLVEVMWLWLSVIIVIINFSKAVCQLASGCSKLRVWSSVLVPISISLGLDSLTHGMWRSARCVVDHIAITARATAPACGRTLSLQAKGVPNFIFEIWIRAVRATGTLRGGASEMARTLR